MNNEQRKSHLKAFIEQEQRAIQANKETITEAKRNCKASITDARKRIANRQAGIKEARLLLKTYNKIK